MNAGFVVVVVLIAGLMVLASMMARKRGYSHNQRIVLSGVAIALLVWSLVPRDRAGLVSEPGKVAVVLLGIAIVVAAVRYLGKQD